MKNCFVCNKTLDGEEQFNLPYAATIFTAVGNFGSTVYDPLPPDGDSYLEIFICDICLVERKERVEKIKNMIEKKELSRQTWNYPNSAEQIKEWIGEE